MKAAEEMKREELKSIFDALRNDPQHHLGLGDIRLTIAQQDEILAMVSPLPPAEGAEYNDGVSYGIHVCDAEFHALVQDTFEKFDRLGKINKSDVQSILGELDASSLGDNINPNLCFAEPQPTAEGAEEMDVYKSAVDFVKKAFTDLTHDEWQKLIEVVMKHTTLHAQKIADKMVEEKVKEAVEQEKSDIRQWLLDEGYEILSEKI